MQWGPGQVKPVFHRPLLFFSLRFRGFVLGCTLLLRPFVRSHVSLDAMVQMHLTLLPVCLPAVCLQLYMLSFSLHPIHHRMGGSQSVCGCVPHRRRERRDKKRARKKGDDLSGDTMSAKEKTNTHWEYSPLGVMEDGQARMRTMGLFCVQVLRVRLFYYACIDTPAFLPSFLLPSCVTSFSAFLDYLNFAQKKKPSRKQYYTHWALSIMYQAAPP